jgi:glycosyltransferase involved in cell wall biosynthesis
LKVLIVCRYHNKISPFIAEQVSALNIAGIITEYFLIEGNGFIGYLKSLPYLWKKLNQFKPDIVHAHYGLSGLTACLQWKIPVIITFHGSDINYKRNRIFSKMAILLSSKSIFVSEKLAQKVKKKNPIIIPCGVDLSLFREMNKKECKKLLGLKEHVKYILFPSSFSNNVKNYPLALKAFNEINLENIEMIELKGYKRQEVAYLLNAVDSVLMTSHYEGSPQVIKEAMACGCPIVTVEVGDIHSILKNLEGCYITRYDPYDIAIKIELSLKFDRHTDGRKRIIETGLDSKTIINKIINIYKEVANGKY